MFKIVNTRKQPNIRAKLAINSTDTCACQTCIIPHTSYLRAFARLFRLHFSTHLNRTQYMSPHAPLLVQGYLFTTILHSWRNVLTSYVQRNLRMVCSPVRGYLNTVPNPLEDTGFFAVAKMQSL